MAGRKPMTQTEFETRCESIRQAARARGFRVPRETSPQQTVIAADREVYEFVRTYADQHRTSMRAALTEIVRPLMGK